MPLFMIYIIRQESIKATLIIGPGPLKVIAQPHTYCEINVWRVFRLCRIWRLCSALTTKQTNSPSWFATTMDTLDRTLEKTEGLGEITVLKQGPEDTHSGPLGQCENSRRTIQGQTRDCLTKGAPAPKVL